MRKEKISVCMATYNGEKYIKEQIESIIKQMNENDELIIVDDCSIDGTIHTIKEINDNRIKLYLNENNIGVNKSFERAINLSQNEFIFLSDQDDIWIDGRVDKMILELNKNNVEIVFGNSIYIDNNHQIIKFPVAPLKTNESTLKYENLIKIFAGRAGYFGCALAFKKGYTKFILPFPNYIESHDLWIALSGILNGKCFHIEDNVLYRRIHGENASVLKRSLIKKLKSRIIFIKSIVDIKIKYK